MKNKKFFRLFFYAFLPFSLGFILSCLFRTMNAELMPYLAQIFALSPKNVGFLTSIFFLIYGFAQIPLGVLLDKYGPKLVQSALFLLAGLGLLIFAFATNFIELLIAHIMLGAGIAGGLMSAFKVIIEFFEEKDIALLNALMMTSGGAGILLAAAPTEFFLDHLGWKGMNILYSIMIITNAGLIYFLLPDQKEKPSKRNTLAGQIKGIFIVLRDPFFWKISPLAASALGSFIAFQGLWIEGWFIGVNHITQYRANDYLSVIAISMTLSLLLTGKISDWAKKIELSLKQVLLIFAVIYILDQILILFKFPYLPVAIWFIYGFSSHIFNLCYAIYAGYYPKEVSGRINSAQVLLTYVVVFISQYSMGILIELWPKVGFLHSLSSYQIGFSMIILLQVVTFIWFAASGKITKD